MTEKLSELLDRVPELETVGGDENSGRCQVESTPQALDELKRISADRLYIEPIIVHERLTAAT